MEWCTQSMMTARSALCSSLARNSGALEVSNGRSSSPATWAVHSDTAFSTTSSGIDPYGTGMKTGAPCWSGTMRLQISADCRQTRSSASCHCSMRVDPPTSAAIAKCVDPVLVGEPEQLLDCAERTRNGGGLVERHVRFLLLLRTMAIGPLSRWRPSFGAVRVGMISGRCFSVTSATFGLGGRMPFTPTRPTGYLLRTNGGMNPAWAELTGYS
jgi:hypothetical protein